MSETSVSLTEIKEEFLDTINEAIYIIDSSKKRALENTQLKIMLKRQINQISAIYNKLVQNLVLNDPELIWSLVSEVSFKMQQFLGKLSKDTLLEEIYLSAISINNFVITILGMVRVPTNKYRAYGVASFLMTLLSDENTLSELPSDLSVDNIIELNRRNAWFNAVNSSANMYTTLAPALPAISLNQYVQIANKAFYFVTKVKELSDPKYNEQFLQYAIKNNRNPYEFLSISFAWVSSGMNIVLDASMKFGRNWPDTLNTYGFVKSKSSDEYVEFIREAVASFEQAFTFMDEAYASGKINKNFGDPKQTPALGIYRFFSDILKHGISRTIVFNKINRSTEEGVYVLDISQLTKEEIESAIEDNRHSLKVTETLAPSPAQLLSSQFGQFYQVLFIDLMKLEVLHSIKTNSREDFDLLLLTHEEIFTEDIILATPEIWLVKMLAEIFIDAYFAKTDNFEKYLLEIQKYHYAFELEPKHYIALTTLTIILTYIINNEVTEENKQLLQASYALLHDSNLYVMEKEYKEYADELINYLMGNTDQQLFDRKIEIAPFDPFSWLLPPFSVNGKKIKYQAFNLEFDQIIREI